MSVWQSCVILFVTSIAVSSRKVPESSSLPANHRESEHEESVLQLMFDPDLQVFYDPKTLKYYKLKSPHDRLTWWWQLYAIYVTNKSSLFVFYNLIVKFRAADCGIIKYISHTHINVFSMIFLWLWDICRCLVAWELMSLEKWKKVSVT